MSDSDPTADEMAGLEWWNELSETGRICWLQIAQGSTANPSQRMRGKRANAWLPESERVVAAEVNLHSGALKDRASCASAAEPDFS